MHIAGWATHPQLFSLLLLAGLLLEPTLYLAGLPLWLAGPPLELARLMLELDGTPNLWWATPNKFKDLAGSWL